MNEKNKSEKDSLLLYRYILGDMGIQMLAAINRGAHTKESIHLLSGVSKACVNGRIPVLLSLELITMKDDEFYISKKGVKFLSLINQF
ncbi:MAG: hypothetical protein ACTSRZ_18435 [Promethearchaeota archaeon]